MNELIDLAIKNKFKIKIYPVSESNGLMLVNGWNTKKLWKN